MGVMAPAVGGLLGGGTGAVGGLAAMLMNRRKKKGQGQAQGAGMAAPQGPVLDPMLQAPSFAPENQLGYGQLEGSAGMFGQPVSIDQGGTISEGYPMLDPQRQIQDAPLQDLAFMGQGQQPVLQDQAAGLLEQTQQQPNFSAQGAMGGLFSQNNPWLRRRRQ